MLERNEKKILAATVVAHALDHVSELSFPAVALLISQEFFAGQENYERIGFAAFVAAFCFGVANLPSGRLVDWIGSRRVMLLYLLGTGLALILTGLAPSYPALLFALGLLGSLAGLYHPSGTTLISLGVREQGRALGIHGVGGNLGLALSPFLTAALAAAFGWRHAYFALSLPFFILALLIWLGKVEARRREATPDPNPGAAPEKPYLLLPLLILFAMAIMNGLCYRGFLTFLPAYFAKSIHTALPGREVLLAGSLSTAVLLLGMVGQFLGGHFADRWSPAKIFAGVFLLSSPILFILSRLQNLPLLFAAAGFAFLYFANQPVGNVLLVRLTSTPVRGRIFGLFFFVNFSAGSFMGWIAGVIGERLSLSAIFSVLALCLFLAGAIGLLFILSLRGKQMPGADSS